MYGVKYKVPFKTLSGRDSVVTLEERGYAGSVIELIAGGTPFIINTDQSDLLAPIRSSTATLAVIGSDYLQDLYANDPQGIRVKCEVDGAVKWLGYLLPDTFSQDFSSPEFEYEIECVAALSTLKYRKFDLTDDFVTFKQIILRAKELAGYQTVYLTDSVRTASGKFQDLKISSSNFFDELDEAMTYYEILEEIAKYLGCCFVPHEDDLYLIDYAAIIKGYNTYTKIDGTNETTVTLSDSRIVSNYKGTDAKISRIAGKNKASVKCSLYEIKDIFPTFNDEGSSFVSMEEADFQLKEGTQLRDYKGLRRFYKHQKFEFWKYWSFPPFVEMYGGINESGILGVYELGSLFTRFTSYPMDSIPSKLNFTDELFVKNYNTESEAEWGFHLTTANPIFRMKSKNKILVHPNVYFCINMQMKAQENPYLSMYETSVYANDYQAFQKALFRIGNYYWNGTSWTINESRFDMRWSTFKKGTPKYGNYVPLDNTNTFNTGLGDLQGYTFKAPDFFLSGDFEFILYAPLDNPHFGEGLRGRYCFYKDITISYGIPNEQSIYGDWVSKDTKSDALYENVIDEEFIEEADTVDLKICSNTDGKLALSSVIEGNSFLQELVSDAYGTDLPEHLLLDRITDTFKTPRFQINPTLEYGAKPYTVYTEPHLNRQFLFAGGEIDIKRGSATYNLIEL